MWMLLRLDTTFPYVACDALWVVQEIIGSVVASPPLREVHRRYAGAERIAGKNRVPLGVLAEIAAFLEMADIPKELKERITKGVAAGRTPLLAAMSKKSQDAEEI